MKKLVTIRTVIETDEYFGSEYCDYDCIHFDKETKKHNVGSDTHLCTLYNKEMDYEMKETNVYRCKRCKQCLDSKQEKL